MTDFAAYKKILATMDDDRAYFTDEELAESPAERKARLAAASLPKGTCPQCRVHIGKGVHFHVKHCKG